MRCQVDEIKLLLRKYYYKAKNSELQLKTQISNENSFSLQSENTLQTSPSLHPLGLPPPHNRRKAKKDTVLSAQLRPVTEFGDNSPSIRILSPDNKKDNSFNLSFIESEVPHSQGNCHSFMEIKDCKGN